MKQLVSYFKSFCSQFKEGEFYRRNFKFFKEPKFSGLPQRDSAEDYPFKEFVIKQVVYRSKTVGYCVEEAFSHLGLWNGFGGGNVSEVHIGYFENSKHSMNPLITVFEDEENWYFRIANAGSYVKDPELHVLFFRGTATVVRIDLTNLKHFYEIDYKDKVSVFRTHQYYAGGFIETKQSYLRGMSKYPRAYEVVPPSCIFSVWSKDGELAQEYLLKYNNLPKQEAPEQIHIRNEDLDNVNMAQCQHCGIIYTKAWFDTGKCSVTCQFDPKPSKKILPSGYNYAQEQFIRKRYPFLDKMGIEICKTWFDDEYYLEEQMARYYMSEKERWQYFTDDEMKSKALVIYTGFRPNAKIVREKGDERPLKCSLRRKRKAQVSFITEALEDSVNKIVEKHYRKVKIIKNLPEYRKYFNSLKICEIQKKISQIHVNLSTKYVELLQLEYELQNFIQRPRALKALVDLIDLQKFLITKGLNRRIQVISHSSMTYQEVNDRVLELFGSLSSWSANGKDYKFKLKEKQKNIKFNSMNSLLKRRDFNVYISKTSFVVMLSDYSSSKLSYDLLESFLKLGYSERNNFSKSSRYKAISKTPCKVEIYNTSNFGLNIINFTKLLECESSRSIYSTYIDYLKLEKEENIWKWPLNLIQNEETKAIKIKLKDEGWSEKSINLRLSKLKLY